MSDEQRSLVISKTHELQEKKDSDGIFHSIRSFIQSIFGGSTEDAAKDSSEHDIVDDALDIATLLLRSTEEMESVLDGLDGRYIKPKPGGGEFTSKIGRIVVVSHLSYTQLVLVNRLASRRSECFANWKKYPRT